MLQRLTNHVYPSTTHRVVNPPGEQARQPRYSVPFFLHPTPDFMIDVLPSTFTAGNPSRYPEPLTAPGYLQERLREIEQKLGSELGRASRRGRCGRQSIVS